MEDINKDIEILENLLEEGFEAMCYPEAQAIEHLLKAYKELEYKYDKALSDLVQAEHENKELKEENEFLKLKERSRVVGRYGEIEVHDLINKTLANDYIQISLVEEKIEELKEDIKKGKTRYPYILEHKIEVLQELLERRKKKYVYLWII